jgi:hypothetical protein
MLIRLLVQDVLMYSSHMSNTGGTAETDRRAAELTKTAEQYASLGHMDAAARALRAAEEIRGTKPQTQATEDTFSAARHAFHASYTAGLAAMYDEEDAR